MESSVDIKKATSNYKNGKENDWKAKCGSYSSPWDQKDTPAPKSDNRAGKICHRCGKDHRGKECFALKLICRNCNKDGLG